MPIYEYLCAKCGKPFEELVSSSATAVKCPMCRSSRVERQLSVFAAHARGPEPVPPCAAKAGGFTPDCCGGGRCPVAER